MVVCQYFLRGTCRFGSNCRNEHPTGGMGFGKSNSFGTFSKNQLGSTSSNTFGRWQGSSSTDDNTDKVIQTIKQEMNLWEVSKMWPFSCFSHQKEAPCLTDLLDYSPEEIRLEAYKGKESGTFNEYCQKVKQLNDNFIRRRAELKSLTAASWGQEKQKISAQDSSGLFSSQSMAVGTFSGPSLLFSSQPNHSGANNPFAATASKSSLFGSSTGQSVFGKETGSKSTSLFGSSQSSAIGSGSSSIFGSGSQSTFGSKQQVSAFGSGQQATVTVGQQSFFSGGQQSIFGGGQTSAFGRSQQSIFGGAQNSTLGGGQQSAFSGTQQSTLGGGQQSVFGSGQQSAFGGGQQSAFGSGQQPAFGSGQQSAFGGGQQSAFGSGQQSTFGSGQQSAFGGGQQSAFGGQKFPFSGNQQPVATGGLFSKGGQQTSQGLFTQDNLFGSTTQQQTNLLGQSISGLGNTAQNAGLGPNASQIAATTTTTTATSSNSQNPFLQASIQNNQQDSADTVPEVPSALKLSEKDLEAYKSDRFLLGQVPECPPPIELC